ncbi:MAG TPA: molybdenum cofactor guanylyltransferase [Syntrophales bacterium]|nr:molybdenum cofactor guanylyltransferase [Syntrophales bacterium]
MTGIILTGGKNTRMGTNKAFLDIRGERLIDRTVGIFKDLFQEVILSTNSPLDYLDHDCVIVTDIIKDKGALGGIYTGLFFASHEHAFVSACDMPFLNKSFIKYMVEHCGNNDIIVPKPSDGQQPLHAIYSRRCLPAIKRLIDRDQLKITGFYRGLKTLEIPEDVIKSYDPEGKMFINVNTREDLEKILSF